MRKSWGFGIEPQHHPTGAGERRHHSSILVTTRLLAAVNLGLERRGPERLLAMNSAMRQTGVRGIELLVPLCKEQGSHQLSVLIDAEV